MEPLKLKKSTSSKSPGQKPLPVSEGLHARITMRAREIYEQRIRQGALDDWLQAEREILKETRAKRSSKV
jgi:hypothetical protein